MQLEYVTWHAPESPPIAIRRRAMEGIHQEVSEAFAAAPHRGAETGGILLKSHSRSQVVAQEQAAIDFARAHAGPQDRIVASAALIYGFGFDTRLRDDARLGTTSGKMPDIVIVDPLYRDLYDSWKRCV